MINLGAFIKDKRVKDFLYTLNANIISVFSGIFTAFIIPKILGIEQYAYLRIFTFYLGYVGLFHFGFNDGVYVSYGHYDYDQLPKEKFRSYFRFLLAFQVLISIILCVGSFFLISDNIRKVIFIYIAVNLILVNVTTFFEFISQSTRQFKLYSNNIIISKILYIVGVILFWLLKEQNSIYLILLQTLISLIILFIYLYTYRELIVGKSEKIAKNIENIKNSFSIGFFVMIGNLMAVIIIGLDRFFIDRFFTIKEFAMYSFSVSLLSIFYILLSTITKVVYPYLARMDSKNANSVYVNMEKILFITLGAALSGYFILKFIVARYLNHYVDSMGITLILLPTVLLNAQITIVSGNFYKMLKLQKEYTFNNILALAVSFVVLVITFLLHKSMNAIALASLVSFYLWLLYSDYFFKKKIGVNNTKLHIIQAITIVLFIVIGTYCNWYIGFLAYLLVFTIIVIIFFKKDIIDIIQNLKGLGKK